MKMKLSGGKKLFLFFSLFAFTILATKSVFAFRSTKGEESYQDIFNQEIYTTDDVNQPSFTNESMLAVIASLNDKILGCIGENCPEEEKVLGAVSGVGNLIAGLYANPAVSSAEYFADLGKSLNLVKPAYAQGIGFEGLRPVLNLWRAFRNVAYLFFTVVFVAIGFAIMFRVKINPQTVITIQNALPRMIIALVLVTFSYAIAGFIIDLIYVAIGLIAAIFDSSGLIERSGELGPQYMNASIWTALGAVFGTGFRSLLSLIRSLLLPSSIAGGLAGGIIFTVTGLATGPLWGALAALGGPALLVTLIFSLVLLFTVLRLFWALLRAYVLIIMGVIFGPLQIMLGAIPGLPGFGAWLKNLIANAAVFPAVATMFMLAAIIGQSPQITGPGWSPPFLKVGENLDAVRQLIALGILLITPRVADMIQSFISQQPFQYGTAVGEGFGLVHTGARWSVRAGVAPTARAIGITETAPRATMRDRLFRWGRTIGLWKE